jgi:hypothetical protein
MSDRPAHERLAAALKEQARLADMFDRSIGTSAELASMGRLEAANLRVTILERAVDPFDPERHA